MRLVPPETFAESSAGKARQPLPPPRIGGGIVYCLVALIAGAAIFLEAATHVCAKNIFDPMPTKLHLAVLIPVPVLLFLSWFFPAGAGGCSVRTLRRLMCANGFLIAVSLAYAALFLPLMPMALIGTAFYGLGLLPLSPSFVLVAAIFQRLQLRGQAERAGAGGMRKCWLAGFTAAALLLGGWAGYSALMERAMIMADSSAAGKREEGLDRIRLLRGEHYVLARCFSRKFRGEWEVDPASAARLLYYRLTGRDYRGEKLAFWYFAPGADMKANGDG